MTSSRTRWIVACATGLLLAGCDDGPAADPSVAPKTASKAPKTVNPLPPEMVAAVTSKQNVGVVTVHFTLNGAPTVMKPLPVDIAIVTHRPVLSLNAHFEARDGLAVATGDTLETLSAPKPETVIKHQLILLPRQEGVFMVVAIVDTETSEGVVSRIYSIPVIVAAPAPAAAPAAPKPVPAPATNPASG
jgi:hypothetical protein